MLKFWIKIISRNYIKHQAFSIINITGLSLALSCAVVILFFINDEFLFDRFHVNKNRIYRVNSILQINGDETHYSTSSSPLSESIKLKIPEVEQVSRLFNRQVNIRVQDDLNNSPDYVYTEDHLYFTDPSIFKVFSFVIIRGNASKPLVNPNQVAISRKIANKYFGSIENAIGKELQLEGTIPLIVSAVFEDYPSQSSQSIELITHLDNYFNLESPSIREYLKSDWIYSHLLTYILLRPDSKVSNVENKIQKLFIEGSNNLANIKLRYELQPLLKIHLYSHFANDDDLERISYIYIFATIGLLILLIGCINFINLTIVHSLKRAREIGIRKVLGEGRYKLIYQFIIESLIYVVIAFAISLIIVYTFLPSINQLVGKKLDVGVLLNFTMILKLLPILIFAILISGLYPGVYVTRFNAVSILKGFEKVNTHKVLPVRRLLVITQFVVSITLIVLSVLIFKQMKFIKDKPLGFQRDNMVTLPIFPSNPNAILGGSVDSSTRARLNSFKNHLLEDASIEAITISSVLPGGLSTPALVKTDKIAYADNVFVPVISVDYDFLSTYKIELLAGRDFSKEAGSDHLNSFIANEAAVKALGWEKPSNAIGQNIEALNKKAIIIGVIKNYNFEGLQYPLRPLLLEVNVNKFSIFSIRMNDFDHKDTMKRIKDIWSKMFPDKPFEWNYLNTKLDENYSNEQKFGVLINYFSWITILISALGLFGLSYYISHERQKEVSIRKILGATTGQVFLTLSKEFALIILISLFMAFPVGYFVSLNWLSTFAFQVQFGWEPFMVAFVGTFMTVFVTTSYQTIKISSTDPIKSLKEDG